MTYASSAAPGVPVVLDADSHLMELPDFLARNVERSMRDRIPTLNEIRLADVGETMRSYHGSAGHTPETVAERVALGDRLTRGPKWHDALGAFNGKERGLALDLLGFERQVVFSSFCATKVFNEPDPDVRRAAAAAHNRSMAEFSRRRFTPDRRRSGSTRRSRRRPGAHRRSPSPGPRGDLDSVPRPRWPLPRPPAARSHLAAPCGIGHAVHPARRQFVACHSRRVDERRSP